MNISSRPQKFYFATFFQSLFFFSFFPYSIKIRLLDSKGYLAFSLSLSFFLSLSLSLSLYWDSRIRLPPGTSVLDMTLNCIWWWGSSPETLENIEYLVNPLTPRYPLTRTVVPVRVVSKGQRECAIIYKVLLLLVIWNHTAVCKLFTFH